MKNKKFINKIVLLVAVIIAFIAFSAASFATDVKENNEQKEVTVYYSSSSLTPIDGVNYLFMVELHNKTDQNVVVKEIAFNAYTSQDSRIVVNYTIYYGSTLEIAANSSYQVVETIDFKNVDFNGQQVPQNLFYDEIKLDKVKIGDREFKITDCASGDYHNTLCLVVGSISIAIVLGCAIALAIIVLKEKKKSSTPTPVVAELPEKEQIETTPITSEEKPQEKHILITEIVTHLEDEEHTKLEKPRRYEDLIALFDSKVVGRGKNQIRLESVAADKIAVTGIGAEVSEIIDKKVNLKAKGPIYLTRGETKKITFAIHNRTTRFMVEFL